MKGNIYTCVNKNDWFSRSGLFILGHPRNEIRFISPAMKSNVNRISFMVNLNFVSSKFHFGFHANTTLIKKKKMTSIKHIVTATYQKNVRIMRSKITENKKFTNQLENIRKIKHHLYLQNRIEIEGNTLKDTSMESVNNCENSNKISTTKHLTKSTNY